SGDSSTCLVQSQTLREQTPITSRCSRENPCAGRRNVHIDRPFPPSKSRRTSMKKMIYGLLLATAVMATAPAKAQVWVGTGYDGFAVGFGSGPYYSGPYRGWWGNPYWRGPYASAYDYPYYAANPGYYGRYSRPVVVPDDYVGDAFAYAPGYATEPTY